VRICHSCAHENREGAKFCEECAGSLDSGASFETRRTVTALFCDLVGSTSLGESHDPELLRPILERYFVEMRSAVEGHGGRVQKFIGDAVVATFGVPLAHEDDGLRAVRAAVEMHARLETLSETLPMRLAARIGITTGEVFVPGDDMPVIGDAMNTAARLQSAAEPGGVLLGEPTWRLVRSAVATERVEPLRVKGKAEPVPAWRVVAVDPETKRNATPFVGRERSLQQLEEALRDAVDARASVLVTILAPPGVGKSRLAAAFAADVRNRATVLVGQTPSYGEGVTFAPLVELLAQAAGNPSGDAEAVAAELRERVATQPDGPSVGDRLAQFLGVGAAVGADTSWAVRRLLEVLAFERPLVIILDDLHWAEPPMLDLADAVVERVHGPVLFVCLARPELLEQRPTWAAGKPRAITTTLQPLSPEDSHRIGELLLGPDAPASIVDRVCETAEGNPLYLEQLTAMLADRGLLVDGRWLGVADAVVDIPGSLQALLAARLDRLGPVPRLALERASIEGRRFRIAALHALASEVPPDEVEAAISSLDRSGLVQPEDEAGGRWRFVHALVVEAAYRGLSKGRRAQLHEELADWLMVADADQADVNESVARHLERALRLREELGVRDEHSDALSLRAGELFASAGARAFAALDLITSRDLLGRAAVLLPESDPRRLDLLPNLGVALTETGRPEETERLLADAVEHGRAAGSERDALRATIQLLSNRVYRSPTDAEIDAAIAQAERAVDTLDAMADDVGVAEAAIALEYLEFMRGRIARAHEWTYRALRHGLAAGRLRESTQAAADVVLYATMGPLPFGRFAETAEERLFPFDEPISTSAGHALMVIGALAAGDEAGFLEHEQRWRVVVERHGLGWLGATHALVIGGVETSTGNPEAGERRLRDARDVLVALGDIWWVASLDSLLCAAVAAQNEPQRFLRLADALDVSPPVPDREVLIQRSLLRARALLIRGSAADAEVAARRGVGLAESTDLVTDHADALRVLADVLDARGLVDEALIARAQAAALLRAKGNLAAIARFGELAT
jgi:class 3 adenylate cyclase/tetratricopeptide (TPR) repeat protein